jgi:NlpC/P60 family putative phage cell wall peptidase
MSVGAEILVESMRESIVAEARTWIGTPYHHKAHVKGHGVDCAWMPIEVYRHFGFIPPDFDPGHYASDWYMHKSEEIYLRQVEKFGRRIEAAKPGDFALFKLGRCACHGAIVIDPDHVIHADLRTGKVEIASISQDLHRRLHSYWTVF